MAEQILTEILFKVLTYISDEIEKSSFPPSARDIAKKFYVTRSRANAYLKHLRRHETVVWGSGDINSLEITEYGMELLKRRLANG